MHRIQLRSARVLKTFPLIFCALALAACNKKTRDAQPDAPQLTPKVTMMDVTFHSAALQRDMQYRLMMPKDIRPSEKLKTVYLLHGGGGGFRDWSNYSAVAQYAERGLILVMPEGNSSYFTNAADRPEDRYEDYIIKDLVREVEDKFPAASSRADRAIVGVSMGGFGAVKLALRHPEMFAFVGGISAALDVPTRPFSIKRLEQWRRHRAIFGPWNGQTQKDNDPFALARSAHASNAPYFFLTCGEQEGLLPTNRQFAVLLEQRHFRHEFHTTPGDHNWKQWDEWIPRLFQSLGEHIAPPTPIAKEGYSARKASTGSTVAARREGR
jgi:putative tributyrin esterase